MSILFNPQNPIIQLCIKGTVLEEKGYMDEAKESFQKAWQYATTDFEKFIVAYHLGSRQLTASKNLEWLRQSLNFAEQIDEDSLKSAYPTIYTKLAHYYEEMGDRENAAKSQAQASFYQGPARDKGPFYHGTKAHLQPNDYLVAGKESNYESDMIMNHIYFTANLNGAGLAASLAAGEGDERVYIVEPTGEFEHDPNVTDKRLPGNLTRSYRSVEPLRILGEVANWSKLTSQERQEWVDRLADNGGEIIN